MDTGRVVRLRTFTGSQGGPYDFGSGYLITAGLVLTAAHVLGDEGSPCEVLRPGSESDWRPAVVHRADRVLDVALVSVTAGSLGAPDPATRPQLGVLPQDDGQWPSWEAAGFPIAGLDGTVRTPEHATGTLPSRSFDPSRAQLTVVSREARPAKDGSGWAGLSGAALFVKDLSGQQLLVGVVIQDPSGYQGGLVASCLAAAPPLFLTAAGIGDPQPVRPSDTELLRWHRQRLADRHGRLNLRGIPTYRHEDVPIDELYIQLETVPDSRPGEPDADSDGAFRESTWSRADDHKLRTVEERLALATPQQALRDALTGGRSLAVLGGPGAGKSTMLHVLAQDRARDPDGPLPLYGQLVDFGRLGMDSIHELVLRDAVAELPDQLAVALRAALSASLSTGRACLLLDGLDEVPEHLVGRIVGKLEEIAENHTVLVTSRPQLFVGLKNFTTLRILPLLPADSVEFVRSWFMVRAAAAGIAPDDRHEWMQRRSRWLADQLADRPQLRDLAANPLMLTFLTMLAADHPREDLPRYRRDIYAAFENGLFHTWETRRSPSPLVSPPARTAIHALHEIALVVHEDSYPVAGAPVMQPAYDDWRLSVACALAAAGRPGERDRGSPPVQAEDAADEAIKFWVAAGLLRPAAAENGYPRYVFTHQTFQEYGAACALAAALARDPQALNAYLRPRLAAAGWGEVLPLTLAVLHTYHVDVTDVLAGWLAESTERENRQTLSRRSADMPLDDPKPDPIRLLLAYSIGEGAIVTDTWLHDTLHWLAGRGTYDDEFRALAMVGWSHPDQVLPHLGRLMRAADARVRIRAAQAAGYLGERDPAKQKLRRHARDPHVAFVWRVLAAWSLARLGEPEEAVEYLSHLVTDQARYLATTALSVAESRSSYHADGTSRQLLAALADLGNSKAVQLLERIAGRRMPLGFAAAIDAVVIVHRRGHQDLACRLLAELTRIPLPPASRNRLQDTREELRCPEAG